MNILSLSYTNIGPFADQTKTVTFLPGSTLVTAPIGSGKSFLFFDGPLFALYKYSSRPMLSRTCKKGMIRCVFHYESQRYLIERQLKPTKSGNDSVQSRLREITTDPTDLLASNSMLQEGDHLFPLLKSHLQEIPFTSGRELDDAMKALLPPRELVQSVYLLMQESNHVFELPPAQRIMVFKHLFGLIGIDQAKDTLTERKKELTTTLKLLEDDTDSTQKFTTLISGLRRGLSTLRGLTIPGGVASGIEKFWSQPTITDLQLVDQEMTMQGFTIEEGLMETIETVTTALQDLQKQGYTLDADRRALQTQLTELQTQQKGASRQIAMVDDQAKKAQHSYAQLDARIPTLQEQSTQAYAQLQALNHTDEIDRSSIPELDDDATLESVVSLIHQTIQAGKDAAQELKLLEHRHTTIQDKHTALTQDIQKLDEQLEAVSVKYDEQMKFHCDKIEGPCPYVEMIKGSAVKSLGQQRQILEDQKAIKIKQREQAGSSTLLQEITQQVATITQQKQDAGRLLGALHWKEVTQRREQYGEAKKHYDTTVQSLQTLQKQREAIDLPDPKTLEAKRTVLQEQIEQFDHTITDKQQQSTSLTTAYTTGNYDTIPTWIEGISSTQHHLIRIQELIATHRDKHQRIQDCKDELKRNKELIAIFSKELMVVALQDFLPNLEQVINTFLDEVVDYQIKFLTPESVSESLELDIEVHDHRGVRKVKSLSGGQRATLKIAWILAVSSLFNGQFLFLDETITSLDSEAVARIGRLLESYMKKRETKLLLVTHAPQIQGMEMWERVVVI